jgi:nucleoside-diphosphate-sugar epimerase
MKRILITGGAGFIGSHVAEELLATDTNTNANQRRQNGYLIEWLP